MTSSFTQEIQAANANRGAEASAAEATTNVDPVEHFAMPQDGEVHPEQKTDSVDLAEAQKNMSAPLSKEGKIRIGNEVFDSTEDAMAYASEIQAAMIKQEAFQEGQKSMTQSEAVVETDWTDEVEKEIFENPKEAIKKIHQKAMADAQKLLDDNETRKIEAIRVQEAQKKTWSNFYETNADLSGAQAQEVVNGILQRDWKELGPMSSDKALDILAKRSRDFIASLKETQLPTTMLQSNKVVTTKSGTPSTATSTQKKSSPLDFISQVNKHRNRTLGKAT